MTQNQLGLVLALLGTLLGGGASWFVARLRSSGTIRTSEAETLWSESQQIRGELRAEVATLRGAVDKAWAEVAALRLQLTELRAETEQLRIDNALLRRQASA